MAEAATQDRQRQRRQWARRLAVALVLVLAYVLAESALRHGVYGRPRIRSATEWKPVVDRLPLLLREPIERRLKAAELESTLATMSDRAQALPLLYKLAPLYSGRQRREVYERIMDGYPGDAHAALAWASYIREFRPPKPVELYLGYATQVTKAPPAELIQVWAIGWSAVMDRPERERDAYLAALAERRLAAAGLVGAYEEWVLSCMRRQRTAELATANELLEQCRELWLQETEKLKP